jgi:hypothetical protein
MVDIVRTSEHELAFSLSKSELHPCISSMKAVLHGLETSELFSRIGCDTEKIESLIEIFECIQWKAFGAEALEAHLADYIKDQ